MDISGKFVFSITDSNLNFGELEKNILIKPTKIIRKGQFVGKLKNIEAPRDIWLYEVKITDNENIFIHLSSLLIQLLPYSNYIKNMIDQYEEVAISCYLRSDFGQIGFQVSSEIISKLEKLGLKLNFHILSLGGIKDT